eukprot:6416905-Pyramimonas_sp.AAC.1
MVLFENAGIDDHERYQVLASVQNKYRYVKIQQAFGMQFDKNHERDHGNAPKQQRRQHRQRTYAAEANDNSESDDEDPESDGHKELLTDTASALA